MKIDVQCFGLCPSLLIRRSFPFAYGKSVRRKIMNSFSVEKLYDFIISFYLASKLVIIDEKIMVCLFRSMEPIFPDERS